MSPREKLVFSIICQNPMISQKEIAEKAGISRSAISVYLDSLYKSGAIVGRGYIINAQSSPVVIGTRHIDIISKTDKTFVEDMYRSCQTTLWFLLKGMANIQHNH